MRDSADRSTRSPRARLLAFGAVLSGMVLVAGCGAGAPSSTTATAGGARTTASTAASSHSSRSGGGGSGPLAFAECMRANGVPNFPDPNAHGPLFNTTGVDTSAPAFQAAQAKCRKLMGGGPSGPGSSTNPSAQTLEKLRRIAVCMRGHGVPQFPDPRTSVPANPPAGVGEISNFDGGILLFPASINMEAPAYRQALAACGAPPLGLPH